ncbi:hypothetical protein MC885_018533 [Smutsia gigantea]|nr:hypothetical protein MC885_018533 [Smutsia gigantea]
MTNPFIEFKAQRLRVQITSILRLTALPGTNTAAAHLPWACFASWAPWSVWGWLDLLRDCSRSCGLLQVRSVSSHSQHLTVQISVTFLLSTSSLGLVRSVSSHSQHLTVQISVTFLLSTSSLGLVFSPAKPLLRLRERALTRSPLPPVALSHCALGAVISVHHLCAGIWHTVGIRFMCQAGHYTGLALIQ